MENKATLNVADLFVSHSVF